MDSGWYSAPLKEGEKWDLVQILLVSCWSSLIPFSTPPSPLLSLHSSLFTAPTSLSPLQFSLMQSHILCPKCYNDPPFEDVPKPMGCNSCTNEKCAYSKIKLGVRECQDCHKGDLVLDPYSGRKWQLSCNNVEYVPSIYVPSCLAAMWSYPTLPYPPGAVWSSHSVLVQPKLWSQIRSVPCALLSSSLPSTPWLVGGSGGDGIWMWA